jgi:hypothetical protein
MDGCAKTEMDASDPAGQLRQPPRRRLAGPRSPTFDFVTEHREDEVLDVDP